MSDQLASSLFPSLFPSLFLLFPLFWEKDDPSTVNGWTMNRWTSMLKRMRAHSQTSRI